MNVARRIAENRERMKARTEHGRLDFDGRKTKVPEMVPGHWIKVRPQ